MDAKNIIPQGERAKYYVRSEKWNFSFEDNVYYLEIIYGLFGQKIVIPKTDFLFLNGMHLFSFPTDDIVGPVKARLVMDIVDPDCPDDVRQEVDEQYIGFVISQPCPQFFKCPKCCGGKEIIYTRTEESDFGEKYALLCDKNGVPFATSEDEYLCIIRTF